MWVFTNNNAEQPVVLCRYADSWQSRPNGRAGKNARHMTRKFSGHLMSDGFLGYDACALEKITLIACWYSGYHIHVAARSADILSAEAHVRRKFKAAYDDSLSAMLANSQLEERAIRAIFTDHAGMYKIERCLRFVMERLPNLRSFDDFRAIAPNRVRKSDFNGDNGKN